MKTNKKGISLIVLAITIIVMIILATAIILSLSGKNIIGSAKEATQSSDSANVKHVVAVAKGEWELGEVEGYTTFKSYAEAKLLEAGLSGYNISENGGISTTYKDKEGKVAYIPEGYIASEVEGENTISGGLVIYEGYEAVTDRNVQEAQKTRNQFVWVPVDSIDSFVRKEYSGVSISATRSYNTSDVTELEQYSAMYNSVKENKGFYIARYEAGKEGTDILVSKKNATVWNAVNWINSKVICEILSTDGAVGHLIYGEEWDAALSFISQTDSTYATNSTNKGNYTETLLKTGSSDDYAINNIYDMAGNVWEWTMEVRSSSNGERVFRGGNVGSGNSSGYRSSRNADYTSVNGGFRSALYIK